VITDVKFPEIFNRGKKRKLKKKQRRNGKNGKMGKMGKKPTSYFQK
jgi:hypothetical protein